MTTQQSQRRIIPIYTSRGEAEAFLVFPYIFNRTGEWIGWVTPKREVYSVLGYYVGALIPSRVYSRLLNPGRSLHLRTFHLHL